MQFGGGLAGAGIGAENGAVIGVAAVDLPDARLGRRAIGQRGHGVAEADIGRQDAIGEQRTQLRGIGGAGFGGQAFDAVLEIVERLYEEGCFRKLGGAGRGEALHAGEHGSRRDDAGAGVRFEAAAVIIDGAGELRDARKKSGDVSRGLDGLAAHQQFGHVEIGAAHVIGDVGVEGREVAGAVAGHEHRFGRFVGGDHRIEIAGERAAGGRARRAHENVERFEAFEAGALERGLRAVGQVAAERVACGVRRQTQFGGEFRIADQFVLRDGLQRLFDFAGDPARRAFGIGAAGACRQHPRREEGAEAGGPESAGVSKRLVHDGFFTGRAL